LSSDATLAVLHQNQAIERDPQRLRELVRARWLVVGDVARAGELWKVQLSASDSLGVVQKGHASGRDLVDAARIASDRLLAALGGKVPRGEEADPRLSERLQRARSALLANELDTARKILMEAPELQRSQPQLRYHLAQIDFRAGQFSRGLRTLDELLDASATGNDRLFGAKLHISRGAMLIRLDRYGESERSYDAAVQALAGTSFAAELGQALTGRAVSRSSQGDFDRALADLGQARMQLTRVGDPLGVARVDANLGNLEMDRDRPALAVDYYRKAASDMQALGAMNELAAIRGMLVSAHLEMLDIGQALEESQRVWLLLERIRDPGQRANVILTRAEALIASGRVSDAGDLLRMPEIRHVVPGEFRRPEFLRMEIARQRNDPQAVLRVADTALRDWPAGHNTPLRGWVLLRRNQAAHQLDIAPLQANPIPEDKVSARLAKAMAGRGRGDAAAAERHYRSALALAEARGVPAEVAEVVEAYAGWLLDIDRAVAAGTLIGRVAPWAEQDFELSLLQVRLFQQMGQREQWNDALRHARELAGERRIPSGLGIFTAKPQRQVSARQ
jgi:tetratricopeptide (TPR) repeat protein